MSLTQSHSAMLKRYMKEELFTAKFSERSYVWKNLTKKLDWAGGVYEVPVKQQGFSSVQMGSLPATNDIAEAAEAMGTINSQKELVMSAIFNEADLTRHSYSEQTYLDLIPGMVDDLTKTAIEQMESAFLRGSGVISKASGNGQVGGTIAVENPEFFQPGQKVEIYDNDTSAVAAYVTAVDINTGVLTIKNARSSGSAVDLSAYTTAQSAVVRLVGTGTETFLDLKTALLPASLGGSDTLYGLTKANYLPLQAWRQDGSGFTASTILKDLLKAFYANRRLGRGEPSEIWVSFGMFANISANLETAKHYYVSDKKAGYGFNSVSLVGNEGEIKIVALNNMPTDVAYIVDNKAMKFAGLPLKKKMYGEAGQEYFTVRNTTGIQFVTDIVQRGDFVIQPGKMGVCYNIPSSVSA